MYTSQCLVALESITCSAAQIKRPPSSATLRCGLILEVPLAQPRHGIHDQAIQLITDLVGFENSIVGNLHSLGIYDWFY
jgi:hypothetical protein